MIVPELIDSCNSVDLPAGLTAKEAYALGHRNGFTARAQLDLVDLFDVADPADAEQRHAVIRRIVDRWRAA